MGKNGVHAQVIQYIHDFTLTGVDVDSVQFTAMEGKLRHEDTAAVANLQKAVGFVFLKKGKNHAESCSLNMTEKTAEVPIGVIYVSCLDQLTWWQ